MICKNGLWVGVTFLKIIQEKMKVWIRWEVRKKKRETQEKTFKNNKKGLVRSHFFSDSSPAQSSISSQTNSFDSNYATPYYLFQCLSSVPNHILQSWNVYNIQATHIVEHLTQRVPQNVFMFKAECRSNDSITWLLLLYIKLGRNQI